MPRFPSGRSDFQTAERRFRLLPDAGLVHFSKCSIQRPRLTLAVKPPEPRQLDCAAPISSLGRKFHCAAPEWVRALANVQGLQPARVRKSSDAWNLSRGT